MTSGGRKTQGCWTCKIRRKRCDSAHPVCGSCQLLHIRCHSELQKPAWMDGAAEQERVRRSITEEIRQNTFRRRERRDVASQDQHIIVTTDEDYRLGLTTNIAGTSSTLAQGEIADMLLTEDNTHKDHVPKDILIVGDESVRGPNMSSTSDASTDDQYNPLFAETSPSNSKLSTSILGREVERGFLMIYLDYVFPFLFPFYQPPLLQTGRHWLLNLVCKSNSAFHMAATLSSYFFSIVLKDSGQPMQKDCKDLVWEQLTGQMDMAFKSIQRDIESIDGNDIQPSLSEKACIFVEVVQVLIVEVTVCRSVDWTIHLNPALALFEDLFNQAGTVSTQPSLDDLLLRIRPQPSEAHGKPVPYTADQSALVFFLALVLFIDTVASTALALPPRLQIYSHHLLTGQWTAEAPFQLESFVGCQNWVLLAIGEISALSAWKKETKCKGILSDVDLAVRAEPIAQALNQGLVDLDRNTAKGHPMVTATSRLRGYFSRLEDISGGQASIALVTQIWAHAAGIYLSVVASGWRPASPEIHSRVVKILALLQTIESPAKVRSLAWPLCIAGSMSLPCQEQTVRGILDNMGELREFGTIREVQGIVEAVWRARDTIDSDTFDLAACLTLLGPPALLI